MANNYNPDVLNCIANLSNDEVFTPPTLANQVLDMLPQSLFADPATTFLDPFTKSGVFLREIVKRLDRGLTAKIPDRQERIDHILHKQVFGIACTELTSLLARRSVYCSKHADGKYSVSPFDTEEGNILYTPLKHTWENGKCKYCGASQSVYDREDTAEQYAYQFIHTTRPNSIFNMTFDVIIGNPPYQLSDGGAAESAKPIYNLFVEQAKRLDPRYLTMIIPARWYSGGKGLDDFRNSMLTDNKIRVIHDFPETNDCFPGVNIRGGVCYFLWDRDSEGPCKIYNHFGGRIISVTERPLLEKGCTTLIRYNIAIDILNKVRAYKEQSFESLVSSRKPFGLATNFTEYHDNRENDNDILIYRKFGKSYVNPHFIEKGHEWIEKHKVLVPYSSPGDDSYPHLILSKPIIAEKNSCCTETYLVVGPFDDETTCESVRSYMMTQFARFMILLAKSSQHVTSKVYTFVPIQDFSHQWTDEMLYEKYGITEEEIAFIDSMIRPMD